MYSSIAAHLTAHILLHLALLTHPKTLSHSQLALSFLPLIWSCHLYTWTQGYGFLAALHGLWSSTLLLFHRPREDFKLIHRCSLFTETDGKKECLHFSEVYPEPLWERFIWVSKLVVAFRFVGWDIGNGKVQIVGPESRGWWLLWEMVKAGVAFVVCDVTSLFMVYDPYFQWETGVDEMFPRRLAGFLGRVGLAGLPSRAVRIAVFGVQQYSVFYLVGSVLAIVFVSLGGLGVVGEYWGAPHSWPPLMGNPVAIFHQGLRGLWGKVWHQLFRQIFVGPGKALAKFVGLPAKSLSSYTIQIAIAFLVSGAFHASTLPPDIPDASPLRYAYFFWFQGACVLLEVLASRTKKVVIGPSEKSDMLKTCLGLVKVAWAGTVLYYTAPLIVDELVRVARQMGNRPVFLFPVPTA